MEQRAIELLNEAERLMSDGRWRAAIEAMIKEPAMLEHNRSLLWSMGWAYYKLDDFCNAAVYLKKAVDCAPAAPISCWALGLVLIELGDTAEAEKQLLRSVAFKDSYDGRIALAFLYQKTENHHLAEAVHKEGIRLRPDHRERLEALADFLCDVGRNEEARAIMKEAEQLPTREERRSKKSRPVTSEAGS
jgi:Tfp pilus assembly protein PilF